MKIDFEFMKNVFEAVLEMLQGYNLMMGSKFTKRLNGLLGHMRIIMELKQRFQSSFSRDEQRMFDTVEKLIDLAKNKQIESSIVGALRVSWEDKDFRFKFITLMTIEKKRFYQGVLKL